MDKFVTIILSLFAFALLSEGMLFLFIYFLLRSRPHYNRARKLREATENSIARSIPGTKAKEEKLKVLDGAINNMRIVREQLANEIQGEHEVSKAAMDSLDAWVRKS